MEERERTPLSTETIHEFATVISSLLDRNRRIGIGGIRSHRKREEVRILFLEMPHVGKPFRNQDNVSPLDISAYMVPIGR